MMFFPSLDPGPRGIDCPVFTDDDKITSNHSVYLYKCQGVCLLSTQQDGDTCYTHGDVRFLFISNTTWIKV